MRTSRRLLKQARRALIVALLFSGSINALMLATPLYTLQVFETVVPTGSVETLIVLSLMVTGTILTLAAVELCRDRILLRAGLWLDHTLGQHILENGLKHGIAPADLKQDAKALGLVRGFLTGHGVGTILDAPWVPLFLVALVLFHPLLGAVAAVAAIALSVAALVQILVTNRVQNEGTRALEKSEQWWTTVAGNAQLAGALGLSRSAARQWELFNRAHVVGSYALGKRNSALRAFARTVRIGAQVGVYGIGAWLVIRGELAPGALVASAILLARVLGPLEQLVMSLKAAQAALGAYRRLKSLPVDALVPAVARAEDAPAGHLVLRDVTYYHPTRRSPALRAVSLATKPGECLGIVGPNGSGKSTLAAIIAGAVAPTAGSADIDSVPIVKWQRGDGPPPVGYLPDEPILLEGSVHDNIARFQDANVLSVARAALRAGVHDILAQLQSGYDTAVGPGGTGLALRERRAVALARSVFGDPRLIVLDEPELGLDGQSLKGLLRILGDLKQTGIGLVIATQDPRLLKLADRVVLLNAGAVQQFCPAAELARRLDEPLQASELQVLNKAVS